MTTFEEQLQNTKSRWETQRLMAQEILAARGIKWPPCSFEIGFGWMPYVEKALDEMIAAGWNKELVQVKEKFCGLRIYIEYQPLIYDRLGEIIGRAEAMCAQLCENCGAPHGLEVPRSGKALCEKCSEMDEYEGAQPSVELPKDPVMK